MTAPAHKGLMDALLAVQAEMPTLRKDATNPAFHSKYVPLDTIVETVGPVLSKHGLVWVTLPGHNGQGEPALTYRLVHASSGEVLEGMMPLLLAKADSQGLGSAITYARRYSLSAVLNLVADEDDDGNAASHAKAAQDDRTAHNASQPSAQPVQATERPASAKQRGLIFARAAKRAMPSSELANAVLFANEAEAREFPSEAEATKWLSRALDRLPASRVNQVLELIDAP